MIKPRLNWRRLRKNILFIYSTVTSLPFKSPANATQSALVIFFPLTADNYGQIDKCKGTGVVVDTVMANVEIVNSKSVQLQVVKSAPTIAVDNTDGATLFLSNSALDMNLLTSKSNTVNVQFEKPGSDGDFIEKTVSEQFHTKIENGALITTAVPRS